MSNIVPFEDREVIRERFRKELCDLSRDDIYKIGSFIVDSLIKNLDNSYSIACYDWIDGGIWVIGYGEDSFGNVPTLRELIENLDNV